MSPRPEKVGGEGWFLRRRPVEAGEQEEKVTESWEQLGAAKRERGGAQLLPIRVRGAKGRAGSLGRWYGGETTSQFSVLNDGYPRPVARG
ncbi:hypothetical protein [Propionibacterium ruminifibrarum]|uniref:hypothetical protein n=1 Tax=Propionibacterium ruminifibrarum TaxID=1962131 RepID=UPI0011C3618D|nr:hypothetical protein [Propionibacterium ruminifibrarum]